MSIVESCIFYKPKSTKCKKQNVNVINNKPLRTYITKTVKEIITSLDENELNKFKHYLSRDSVDSVECFVIKHTNEIVNEIISNASNVKIVNETNVARLVKVAKDTKNNTKLISFTDVKCKNVNVINIHLHSNSAVFNLVIERVFKEREIAFSAKQFKLIYDYFNQNNYSLAALTNQLVYILLCHEYNAIYTSKYYYLCNSFKDAPGLKDLLENDSDLKAYFDDCMLNLEKYRQELLIMLNVYADIYKVAVKKYKLTFVDFYSIYCNRTFNGNFQLKFLFILLKKFTPQQYALLISSILSQLSSHPQLFSNQINRLNEFMQQLNEKYDVTNSSDNQSDTENNINLSENVMHRNTRNSSAAQTLDSFVTTTLFNKKNLLVSLFDYIYQFFKLYLHDLHYSQFVFHELVFIDYTKHTTRAFLPHTRQTLHTCLSKPSNYLPSLVSNALSAHLPDISIVYKLHLESSSSFINLYDWFISFKSILPPESAEHRLLQARFIRCVEELVMLGYIRVTRRKVDHVERLTWGIE